MMEGEQGLPFLSFARELPVLAGEREEVIRGLRGVEPCRAGEECAEAGKGQPCGKKPAAAVDYQHAPLFYGSGAGSTGAPTCGRHENPPTFGGGCTVPVDAGCRMIR